MNGLDLLKQKLREKGYTTSQVERKIVAGVLEIVSNEPGVYTDLYEARKELTRVSAEERQLREQIEQEYKDIRKERIAFTDEKCELYDYISAFNDALQKCETAEARDAMRTAQIFLNSIVVKSAYDNTAMINGLASILTHGNVTEIALLKPVKGKKPYEGCKRL